MTYYNFYYLIIIDPLHGDVTFGYFRIRPFDRRHGGGQKCITVIERKALIVSLLTDESDYSSETTTFVRYKHIDLSMQVLLVTCARDGADLSGVGDGGQGGTSPPSLVSRLSDRAKATKGWGEGKAAANESLVSTVLRFIRFIA